MEMVATGNSKGQAKVFADMNIKMKDSAIQARGFAPTGMLELWDIGNLVKLFCAIMGSGLRLVGPAIRREYWDSGFRESKRNHPHSY